MATLTVGCGGNAHNCAAQSLTITPTSITINHLAAPPANKGTFNGFDNNSTVSSGCAVSEVVAIWTDLKWTSSDPVNAPIGNTLGVDYGIAICNNAAAGPVTITATGPNSVNETISGTASLTCN
jgi:hypothetical protein